MQKPIITAFILLGLFLAMPNVKISIQKAQASACNKATGDGCG